LHAEGALAVASFGTFFSMPWRLLAFPIATGMLAHAARWALITVAGGSVATGALVARMLVSVIVTLLMKSLDVAVLASTRHCEKATSSIAYKLVVRFANAPLKFLVSDRFQRLDVMLSGTHRSAICCHRFSGPRSFNTATCRSASSFRSI
jgi:hypothetical protein